MKKYSINILIGGNSSESYSSIKSYNHIINILNKKKSKIIVENVFFIEKDFVIVYDFKKIPKTEKDLKKRGVKIDLFDLPKELKKTGLYSFSLLMGNHGEDGDIQGISQFYGLSGSFGDVISSSFSMSKSIMSKIIKTDFDNNLIKIILEIKITKNTKITDIRKFINSSVSEYFVIKPNKLGSSILTFKIEREKVVDFIKNNKNIFKYDNQFLLQEFIFGMDVTVGVFENKNNIIVLDPINQITRKHFLGYAEKHDVNNSIKMSYKIKDELKYKLTNISENIFKNYFQNYIRIDYIVNSNGIYFLEVNTIPGLTKYSPFTVMLNKKRINIDEMIFGFIEKSLKIKKTEIDFEKFKLRG
ncbi:MAG: hypothetical protein QMB51_03320 [Patescibacteria group bacterium]